MLAIPDQRSFHHIDCACGRSHQSQPFVMQPFRRKRQRIAQQRATHHDCRASDQVATQQHVEGPPLVNPTQFERIDFKRMKQRAA